MDKLNGLGKNNKKSGEKDKKKKKKKKSIKDDCSSRKNGKNNNKSGDKYEKEKTKEGIKRVWSARKNGKKWEYGVKFTGYDGRIHWLPWSNLNESCRECSFSSWCFSFTKTEHSFLQKYVTPRQTVG